MGHFAQIDENNTVDHVLVVVNDVITDSNGNESEQLGIDFLKSLYGEDTRWVQTSYNGSFRKTTLDLVTSMIQFGMRLFLPNHGTVGY